MPRALPLYLVAAAVTVLIGAGGGSVAAQTPAPCLPTSARIAAPDAFKGIVRRPAAHTLTSPTGFATSTGGSVRSPATEREVTRLESEGFVSGIQQLYQPQHRKHGPQALSVAVQFATAAGAVGQQQGFAKALQRLHRVPVPSIPGAIGVATKGRGPGDSNVLFADDVYFYLVGQAPARGSGIKHTIGVATALYDAEHGQPVCPVPS